MYLSLSVCALSLSLIVSHRAYAVDASEEAQRGFEAELQTIDMKDMKSEYHTAEKEAVEQEQSVASQKRTLAQLKAERAQVERKAKARIAAAEMRRQRALRQQAQFSAEIKRLERQIGSMKATVARHEARAAEAEDLALEEQSDVDALKEERSQLKTSKIPRARRVDAANDYDVEPW